MKPHRIPFSAPMVRGILADRKGMTRRGLRISGFKDFTHFGPSDTPGYDWTFRDVELRWHDLTDAELLARLPYQVGDQLLVTEAWRAPASMDQLSPTQVYHELIGPKGRLAHDRLRFEADGPDQPVAEPMGKLRPGMFLPRELSRIILEVTAVRVERLQVITEADAIAEGICTGHFRDIIPMLQDPASAAAHPPDTPIYWVEGDDSDDAICLTARDAFARLWTSLHGPEDWELNRWLAVYQFRRIW